MENMDHLKMYSSHWTFPFATFNTTVLSEDHTQLPSTPALSEVIPCAVGRLFSLSPCACWPPCELTIVVQVQMTQNEACSHWRLGNSLRHVREYNGKGNINTKSLENWERKKPALNSIVFFLGWKFLLIDWLRLIGDLNMGGDLELGFRDVTVEGGL